MHPVKLCHCLLYLLRQATALQRGRRLSGKVRDAWQGLPTTRNLRDASDSPPGIRVLRGGIGIVFDVSLFRIEPQPHAGHFNRLAIIFQSLEISIHQQARRIRRG